MLIWADLGRRHCSASIPLAFVLGALTFWQLLVVAAWTAVLTTFFDAADNAYLPTVVERERLVEANSALAASGSGAEFSASGSAASSSSSSPGRSRSSSTRSRTSSRRSCLLASARREAPPPPRADREPVLDEIRHGIRLVRHDPVLRAFASAQMLLAGLWGVFGATFFLFALDGSA